MTICFKNELLVCQRQCAVCESWTSRVATEGDKVLYVLCDDHCNARTVKKIQAKENEKQNRSTGLLRIVAELALDFKHKDNIGGKGALKFALESIIAKNNFPILKHEKEILIPYLHDLEQVEIITPRNPYPKASKHFEAAVAAKQRVLKFQSGDDTVYKKKRYKATKEESEILPEAKTIPWNLFNRKVRSKLTRAENKHTSDDSLYCCWEEDWTTTETIDECKAAYEEGKDVRQ